MKYFLLIIFCFSLLSGQSKDRPWSVRIADSFMKNHPDSIVYADEEKSKRWNYEQGVMLEAFHQMWMHTNDQRYQQYVVKNLDHYIRPDGSIATYQLTEFNIDNITQGKAALRVYAQSKKEQYRIAADTIRKQLALHPRTSEGGFWHKKIYPNQMWLDGLYMAEPFYAMYSRMFGDTAAYDDIIRQFLLMAKHAYDAKTGLYFHGWDESKTQLWADKTTGCSPNLWGRALGWYAMALTDVLDELPVGHPKRNELVRILNGLMENLLHQRDERTKTWYQVVDKRDVKGNYPEASASAMFTYVMAKGVNRGYLPATFAVPAKESFAGVLKTFVATETDGTILLNDVVKVSGLGGKPYRDGSVEYYLSEPKRTNDFKGYGPFLLAAIEIEKLEVAR
jgi:unsaturated rhamnogalacturonyl hydrolase